MRGCSRLQVKYELYQAFGESPKTRIRCSAEVSMAFDRYTIWRAGTIVRLNASQKRVGMKLYYKHLRRKFMGAVQYADMRS